MESIPPKYVDQYVQEAGSAVHPLFTHLQKEQRVTKCSFRSEVFDSLKESCFTDTVPIGQGQISVPEKSASFLPYVHEQIFNFSPLYYLPDKTPQARVAILYYLMAENGLYFFYPKK